MVEGAQNFCAGLGAGRSLRPALFRGHQVQADVEHWCSRARPLSLSLSVCFCVCDAALVRVMRLWTNL